MPGDLKLPTGSNGSGRGMATALGNSAQSRLLSGVHFAHYARGFSTPCRGFVFQPQQIRCRCTSVGFLKAGKSLLEVEHCRGGHESSQWRPSRRSSHPWGRLQIVPFHQDPAAWSEMTASGGNRRDVAFRG